MRFSTSRKPVETGTGMIYVGRRGIRDTAPPGTMILKRRSSIRAIPTFDHACAWELRRYRMGDKFHLGERTGLLPRQESRQFPDA